MKGYQSFSMIDFLEWIKQPVVDEICGIGRVIWLTGSTYQPLLVQRILLLFKKQGFIVYHSQSEQEIDSCLHTVSFVEQRVFYWMSDITGYEAARRDLLLKRAYGYQGVPWIGFFSSEPPEKKGFSGISVQFDDRLDQEQCCRLWQALWISDEAMPGWVGKLVAEIFLSRTTLATHEALILLDYATILQEKTSDLLRPWLNDLINTDASLYTLASHFFAKNNVAFFAAWNSLKDQYVEQFWTTFWSEQLFRAYWFVYYQSPPQPVAAQKISVRLPFTFLKKDYKKYSLLELQRAHDDLYRIEWSLKNGSTLGIERLLLKFLVGRYQKENN